MDEEKVVMQHKGAKHFDINYEGTEWLLPCNPDMYHVFDAFRELGSIDWRQHQHQENGDVVYIYVSKPIQRICFKCIVKEANKPQSTIDDSEYMGSLPGEVATFMELEMIQEYDSDLLSIDMLRQHGIHSTQGGQKLKLETKEYVRIVDYLLNAEDFDADTYDPTYQLTREVVKSYENMNNLEKCTTKDLNLIYTTVLLTTNIHYETKIERIKEDKWNNLPENERNRLVEIYKSIKKKVDEGYYSNRECPENFGMFGTGTFTTTYNDEDARTIIRALIDVNNANDEASIEIVKELIKNTLPGFGMSMLSTILHCLKPTVFPVINGNEGFDNYSYFDLKISKKSISDYIDDLKIIREFRDKYFKFKNYRVWDITAEFMVESKTDIDYLSIVKFLSNYAGQAYADPKKEDSPELQEKYQNILENGKGNSKVLKKIAKLCKTKFGLEVKPNTIKWLDGSNSKVRDYSWIQLVLPEYMDSNKLLSIFIEKDAEGNNYRYRVDIEYKLDTISKEELDLAFQNVLANKTEDLKIFATRKLYDPVFIPELENNEIKEKLNTNEYVNIMLGDYIEYDDQITNDRCEEFILNTMQKLLPVYRSMLTIKGDYWPTLEEYNPGITTEQWIAILNNTVLNNEDYFGPVRLGALAAFYQAGGESTCKALDEKWHRKPGSIKFLFVIMCKYVAKVTKCPLCLDNTNKPKYWPIMFVGRDAKEDEIGTYVWKLRDELYDALTKINILDHLWNQEVNYWLYEPGDKACNWDDVYRKGILELTTDNLGNLEEITSKEELRSQLEKANVEGSINSKELEKWQFINYMKPEDVVYIRVGTSSILGRGIVDSEYYYDENDQQYAHKVKMNWTHKGDWKLDCPSAFTKEITKIDKSIHQDYIDDLEKLFDVNPNVGGENKVEFDKNLILYGPPGTGKTYNTVNYAVAIIENRTIDDVSQQDRDEVRAAYDEYVNKGLIGFTTFHQAYGYEEFIEGIKPVVDQEEDKVSYTIEPGVFKKFCNSTKAISTEVKDYGFNADPTIWKVSLAATGDNPVRTDCMQNNHIRIGWDEYGQDLTNISNYTIGGKAVLEAFTSKMRIGDIVMSCYSASTVDAIGVVTGDYEWHNEYYEYKRVRNVKWIIKGINEDIISINHGASMTLASVYKLNINLEDVTNIIQKYQNPGKRIQDNNNYVFIIDEINRGNISKIFGELITLIEPSKREGCEEATSVILPYSNTKFSVPNNVYILGTMNTADRSIALMDTALRRRFSFIEMQPDASLLKDKQVEGIDLEAMLKAINERIEYLYDREHTIGHSFFMHLDNHSTVKDLAEVFKKNIIPLLQEYFFEDYQKIQLVLCDTAKSDDLYKFILEETHDVDTLFKKSIDGDEYDLDRKKYKINDKAFYEVESYKQIY